jgi:hypothetical protein
MHDVIGECHRLEAALLRAYGQLEQVVGIVERGRDDELHEASGSANVPTRQFAGQGSGRESKS